MNRYVWPCAVLALAVSAFGCAMCKSPYDYAGPTIGHDGQPAGGFATRAGSVLSGPEGPVGVYHMEQTPTPATPTAPVE